MRRLLIVIALLYAHGSQAGDFEDGMAALERKDYAIALKKFLSSAQQGNAKSQLHLAFMYQDGLGVLQDYKEAVWWYRIAARQGNSEAQFNLGFVYGEGRGAIQDYVRAHMWFNIAAANLEPGGKEGRDIVKNLMSPQQIEQAQRMARECMASNFKKCD